MEMDRITSSCAIDGPVGGPRGAAHLASTHKKGSEAYGIISKSGSSQERSK